MTRRRQHGITLIELMVVVVIIAILAGVAYPSYRQYAIRTNRTEAKTALLQLTQNLEKCYTRWHAYDAAGCTVETDIETQNYTITAAAIGASTYSLTATPKGGQAEDKKCSTLGINELGTKTKSGTGTVKECW